MEGGADTREGGRDWLRMVGETQRMVVKNWVGFKASTEG
jgi:hypothetical protein